ncbi:MAG: hypothetical protein ONB32_15705 [candidate division KSB1 bacterium]|nr:hypothetical protein [candidate division KSB1 bacterium]
MRIVVVLPWMFLLAVSSLQAFDFPDISGWQPISDVMSYTPENLYEYIDGAADQFIAYGFVELLSRDLASDSLQVTVDIYDMGELLNAYGIYRNERPRNVATMAIGTEAYIAPPYQALMFKANYYVKINAFEGEINSENVLGLLKALAAALPGETEFPEQLSQLPATGRIQDSEGYTRQAFIGLPELNRCLYAFYQADSKQFRHFVLLPDENINQTEIWQELSQKWRRIQHNNRFVLFRSVPYVGLIGVIQVGQKIVGVTDCEDQAELLARLSAVEKP